MLLWCFKSLRSCINFSISDSSEITLWIAQHIISILCPLKCITYALSRIFSFIWFKLFQGIWFGRHLNALLLIEPQQKKAFQWSNKKSWKRFSTELKSLETIKQKNQESLFSALSLSQHEILYEEINRSIQICWIWRSRLLLSFRGLRDNEHFLLTFWGFS